MAAAEELRVLFQFTVMFVPVSKVCEYWLLNCEEWDLRPARAAVPVPEIKGLLTGTEMSAMETLLETIGSKVTMLRENGLTFAEEEENAPPGVAKPKLLPLHPPFS